jgi:UDP-N-acetylglucosamine transferase subunit ALG13
VTVRIPAPRAPVDGPLVLAVVGTDMHAFDRLTDWLTAWWREGSAQPVRAAVHPRPAIAPRQVRMVLQYGHGRTPDLPDATAFLDHAALQAAMADAALVVSHGGPATITEARRTGHLPIVVPRDPGHGEHVDNHQQLFARRLGEAGLVRLCETRASLVAALEAGLTDPGLFRLSNDAHTQSAQAVAVSRVGQIIDDLVDAGRTSKRRWRPW